jgi:hypothetical protein
VPTASLDLHFAPAVLRGLSALGLPECSQPDLALELGLSAWMRFSGTDLESAQSDMLAMRTAVLEAAEMDVATEPVPFTGQTPRAAILNLAAYLGNLIARAAALTQCEPTEIVEQAIAILRP